MLSDPEESKTDAVGAPWKCPDCGVEIPAGWPGMIRCGVQVAGLLQDSPGLRIGDAATESINGGSKEKS